MSGIARASSHPSTNVGFPPSQILGPNHGSVLRQRLDRCLQQPFYTGTRRLRFECIGWPAEATGQLSNFDPPSRNGSLLNTIKRGAA
jgi:hypothetical protein